MSHIPFALAAYFLNSISVLIDKFMVTKHIPNPLIYVFYLSVLSLVVLAAIPFTHIPNLPVFILASISTLLWTSGWYFMFKALQVGVASRVIPVIGTLIPLVLLIEATLISTEITSEQTLAVIILILGLAVLTIKDWKGPVPNSLGLSKLEMIYITLSAFFFAISYLFLREAYLKDNFLTVLVWSRIILIPIGIGLILIPKCRKIILNRTHQTVDFNWKSKLGLLFLSGQAAGAGSELLLTYSISLASPALVNSLQGTQYIFLLCFSFLLAKKHPEVFKEHHNWLGILSKVVGVLLIAWGLYLLAFSSQAMI